MQSELRYLLMVLNCVNIMVLFVGLGSLLRKVGISRRSRAWCLSMILLAYSYIDVFVIGRQLGNLLEITTIVPALANIWTKIEGFSGLSHSYLRDFWVEPHAVAALLFLVTAVLVYRQKESPMPTPLRGAFVGLLTLTAFGCDSFLGLVLALWIGLDIVLDLIRKPSSYRRTLAFVLGVAPVAGVGCFYIFGLDMIGGQGGMISIDPLTGVIATLPFYLTLDYGPIFLIGAAGWWGYWRRRKTDQATPVGRIWLMAILALGIGLLLRHEVEYDIFLRKAGKPLQFVLLIGCGLAIDYLRQYRGNRLRIIAASVALVALPSLALDLQAFGGFAGSRGLQNSISSEDIQALKWLRNNTEPDAVIQGRPGYQGEYLYEINPIPALAERRVAVATYMIASLWGVGGAAAIERKHEVDSMFQTDDETKLRRWLDDLRIDYLYLGSQERMQYELHSKLLWENSLLFQEVYDRQGVKILHYRGDTKLTSDPNTDSSVDRSL